MSKVIDSGSLKDIQLWKVPEFEAQQRSLDAAESKAMSDSVNLLTAEQIAEIQAQAYQEGFNQGREEGREAGLDDMKAKATQLETLMAGLSKPFEHLDDQVEQELLSLAAALTRTLVYREIETDSSTLLPAVREAMAALPVAARDVQLHLHPHDASLVRESLALSDGERSWKIVEDPVLEPGDCRVTSNTSQIDATVESRLNSLLNSVFQKEQTEESEF
ncbi:MAG: flagellar assembly protein FliH [Gammaproteobacteria bacterium]|nr:flagellar assembly protein FliH [Gammaproteobacteria bacterium]